jgi:hypothetical protein
VLAPGGLFCCYNFLRCRLQKDILIIKEIVGINIVHTEESNSVIITIPIQAGLGNARALADEIMADTPLNSPTLSDAMTAVIAPYNDVDDEDNNVESVAFLITVSKYYPHVCPEVRCASIGFSHGCHITADGHVFHPLLGDNWSAIMSLTDIVQMLVLVLQSPPDYGLYDNNMMFGLNAGLRYGNELGFGAGIINTHSDSTAVMMMDELSNVQHQLLRVNSNRTDDSVTDLDVNSVTYDVETNDLASNNSSGRNSLTGGNVIINVNGNGNDQGLYYHNNMSHMGIGNGDNGDNSGGLLLRSNPQRLAMLQNNFGGNDGSNGNSYDMNVV